MFDYTEQELRNESYYILTDPYFENRLKSFDPNLKLIFDHGQKRWTILERTPDPNKYNAVLVCEDRDGKEKPLGEWVFNKLFVSRKLHEDRVRQHQYVNYADQMMRDNVELAQKELQKTSDEAKYGMKQFAGEVKKLFHKSMNLPVSDIRAGYAKVKTKVRGHVYS